MQPERVDLYFQQGSSDKVYHLQLEGAQHQWSVQARWGRRGSALQSDVKVSGTSYEEAKRVYDRILREKTGKGYQLAHASANGNEAIAVGLPATTEHSGHTPELLTPIEEPEALLLAQDATWWFQQKFDGRRLAVQKSDGKYSGINKLGQIIPIDSRLRYGCYGRPSLQQAIENLSSREPDRREVPSDPCKREVKKIRRRPVCPRVPTCKDSSSGASCRT